MSVARAIFESWRGLVSNIGSAVGDLRFVIARRFWRANLPAWLACWGRIDVGSLLD
jgi:hypothetical protein